MSPCSGLHPMAKPKGIDMTTTSPTLGHAVSRQAHEIAPRQTISRTVLMAPIWFFEAFLTITVLLFAFGPWPWPVNNPIKLYGFLVLSQMCLWAGYRSAINRSPRGYSGWIGAKRLTLVSLIVSAVWFIPNHQLRSGSTNAFDVIEFWNAVGKGLTDPGDAYNERQKAYNEQRQTVIGNRTTMGQMAVVLSFAVYPLMWFLFPLGVVYWSVLSRRMRIAVVVLLLLDLLSWISFGTNKGLADYLLLLPWMLFARNPWSFLVHARAYIIVVLAGFILFLSFFVSGIAGRMGGEIGYEDETAEMVLDTDNWMVAALPPKAQTAFGAFTSYVTQGYFGLSLALDEPFDCCYGFGNSYFTIGLSDHLFASGFIADRTYPAKIHAAYGWDMYGRWCTFYPWIASDVTFLGALIVMFLIGRLLALVWLDVLKRQNPFAVALFPLVLMMLFYVSANNQVLHFSSTLFPFWTILVLWLLTRKRETQYAIAR